MQTQGCRQMWLAGAFALLAACMPAGNTSDGGTAPVGPGDEPGTEQTGTTPGSTPTSPGDVPSTRPGGGDAGVPAQPNATGPTVQLPNPGTTLPSGGNGLVQQQNLTYDARYPYALVGRFDATDPNRIRFSFPGSKIGVAFTGTSLHVRLTDTAPDTLDVVVDGVQYATPGDAWSVDAKAPLVACVPATQVPAFDGNNFPGCVLGVKSSDPNEPTSYPVVAGLAEGNHVVWLTKRSEAAKGGGIVTLWGVELAAGGKLLAPPPYLTRRIEVLGDSSTSGYGAGQRNPCVYTTRTSDASRDLPSYLATYLHAERVNTSIQGAGVYNSFYDEGNASHLLPVVYRQTLGFQATPAYDFAKDHVDVIVIAGGGGDLFGANGAGSFRHIDKTLTSPARDGFVKSYVEMLAFMRSARPNATIVATLVYAAAGNDVVTLGSAVQDAVASRQAAGDANVLFFSYFPQNDPVENPKKISVVEYLIDKNKETLWKGCVGHASPGLAKVLAAQLGPVIAERMGWKDVGY